MEASKIVIPLIAAMIALAVAWLLAVLLHIGKKEKQRSRPGRRAGLILLLWLLLFLLGGIGYFSIYYHADARAEAYMASGEGVEVSQIRNGYFFDGPGSDAALIFYPGAKVASEAYAPVMHMLAKEGVDCFLMEMPLHMAFMGRERAEEVMAHYDYDAWYLCGHSLGGAMASIYTAEHSTELDGLILLASYSTAPLSEDLQVVTLVGSEDGVINRDAYAANQSNLPSDAEEIILEGGNHAQYGSYGTQRGDGEPGISEEEQQEATVALILASIRR